MRSDYLSLAGCVQFFTRSICHCRAVFAGSRGHDWSPGVLIFDMEGRNFKIPHLTLRGKVAIISLCDFGWLSCSR